MATILNIETSTPVCSVAIGINGICKNLRISIPSDDNLDKTSHSKLLAVFIKEILEEAKITAHQLDSVAISAGPGSYTGLRIGTSTAKGICLGGNSSLISIDTMTIIAEMAAKKTNNQFDLFIPMTDARRMEVYYAIFDENLTQIQKTQSKIIENDSFIELGRDKIAICGDGAQKCISLLSKLNVEIIPDVFPSAEFMCKLSENAFINKQFADLAYFEPFYLKDFIATTPRKPLF